MVTLTVMRRGGCSLPKMVTDLGRTNSRQTVAAREVEAATMNSNAATVKMRCVFMGAILRRGVRESSADVALSGQ